MTSKKEIRQYPYIDKYGREKRMNVTYTLYFEGSGLIDVRNQFNHAVDKKSEVWEFFSNKYS